MRPSRQRRRSRRKHQHWSPNRLGRPPRVGDNVRYERLQLEVTAVKGHGVEQAAVSLLPATSDRPQDRPA